MNKISFCIKSAFNVIPVLLLCDCRSTDVIICTLSCWLDWLFCFCIQVLFIVTAWFWPVSKNDSWESDLTPAGSVLTDQGAVELPAWSVGVWEWPSAFWASEPKSHWGTCALNLKYNFFLNTCRSNNEIKNPLIVVL